jgi:hypothetical protein
LCYGCYEKTYIRIKKLCSVCNRVRRLDTINPARCHSCYTIHRYNTDPAFRTKCLVRNKIRKVFKSGKESSVLKKYYIDAHKIAEHLGKQPDGDHHIDHILPLFAFDLTDPLHIYAAFHPSNHQWLLARENLSKNAKYNQKDLETHLEMCKKTIPLGIGGGGR